MSSLKGACTDDFLCCMRGNILPFADAAAAAPPPTLPSVAAGLAWSAATPSPSSSVGVQLDGKSRIEEREERRGVLVSPETSTTVRKLDDDDDDAAPPFSWLQMCQEG